MNSIINELLVLFNKKILVVQIKKFINNYITEILKILLSNGRMFYVGILLLIISILFYFIDITN